MPEAVHNLPEPLAQAVTLVCEDREHGASWLSRHVAEALASAVHARASSVTPDGIATLHQAARAFARARPSMAAVANTAARIWQAASAAQTQGAVAQLAAIRSEAERLMSQWQDAATAITQFARPLLGATVYTHSRSGTVEQVLTRLAIRAGGPLKRVIVDVSWPGGEGVAAARAFAEAGMQVTLVADGACGLFLPDAQAVVIGADSVRADGSVVNKVGSFPLAVTAQTLGVPVYALCETLKIAAPSFPLTLEEMRPEELLPRLVAGVTARNVYFDRTPAEYITSVVTEEGILDATAVASRARAAGDALATLKGDEG